MARLGAQAGRQQSDLVGVARASFRYAAHLRRDVAHRNLAHHRRQVGVRPGRRADSRHGVRSILLGRIERPDWHAYSEQFARASY